MAFHDSNLNAQERAVIERFYRDRDGGIRVLTATSGIAAGVNTPASTVIIVETAQPRPGNPPMFIGDVRNMAGRAGRYGLQETGRAIILADTSIERQRLFARYVQAEPEPIRSSFDMRDIPTWLLRLLRQVGRIARNGVPALLVNTFGGYLATRRNPDLAHELQEQVAALLQRMVSNSLLDETVDGVALTMLGNACGSSSLQFESCLRLIEAVRRLGNARLSPDALIVLLQILPEGEEIYVPVQRKGTAEGRWQISFFSAFGTSLANEIARYAVDTFALWARQKRALIAQAWIRGTPIEQIERSFSVNPFNRVAAGDIRGVAETMRFRLRSVYEIVAAASPGTAPEAEDMDVLLRRLEFGVPANALFLLQLPVSLTRAEMLSVIEAGIVSLELFDSLSQQDLESRFPETLVKKLTSKSGPG